MVLDPDLRIVLQIKSYVRDIFAEAVEQDFLTKDPARKVTVPSQLRDTDRTTLTREQLRDALLQLALRDRVLLGLDMTNALRPSELFALRWKCFNYAESKMQVFETAYNGAIRPWGKTVPLTLKNRDVLLRHESGDATAFAPLRAPSCGRRDYRSGILNAPPLPNPNRYCWRVELRRMPAARPSPKHALSR